MKRVSLFRFHGLLLGLILLAGCGGKQVNPATLTPDDLYQRASTAYEARSYGRAIPLLEVFVQQHLGDERAPQARMMLGRAYLARRDYVTAATHFQRLVEDFPNSPLNLEGRFAICDAYVRLSPKPALDQEYTNAAISHCESVATNFPGTSEAEQAAAHLAALRVKLAQKAYDTGMFYFKRKAYDASVVYFNDVVTSYPQTPLAPTALKQLMDTYQLIGYVEEAAEAKARLLKEYPDSPEARAVQA